MIALDLGGGFTRNAVIGKMHRLGLSAGGAVRVPPGPKVRRAAGSPAPPPSKPRPKKAKRPQIEIIRHKAETRKQDRIPVESKPTGRPTVFSVMDLQALHCRWPYGHPGRPGFGFCGAIKTTGSSYCSHHHAMSLGGGTPSERRAVRDIVQVIRQEEREHEQERHRA